MQPPLNPGGEFVAEDNYSHQRRNELIQIIASLPADLASAVEKLSDDQLNTRYRNWTIRQIVHHLADSHMNAFTRFKLALTEDSPRIKPYDETKWAELSDSKSCDVRVSLIILQGIHARWSELLRSMTDEQFSRTFFHPEHNKQLTLSASLCSYAWHCRHHKAQILWIRQQRGW